MTIVINDGDRGGEVVYRAEMWERPKVGYILASTRWVSTREQAEADASRCLSRPTKLYEPKV